jgi:hypothetical protein
MNVAYGTPSIQLDYNFFGIVSIQNTGGAFDVRNHVFNASGSPAGTISGIQNQTLQLYWPPNSHRTPGNWHRDAQRFTYAPNGGFRTSGIYTITLDSRVINHFASGPYGCAAPGGGGVPGWNFDQCPQQNPSFNVYIDVGPAPTISCGSSNATTSPVSPEPGEDVTINTSFSVGGGAAGQPIIYTIFNDVPGADPPPVSGAPGGLAAFLGTVSGGVGSGTLPNFFRPQPIRFGTPGVKNGTYQIITNGTTVPSVITCPFQFTVASKPYTRVFGGDVFAGAAFGSPCYDPNSRVIGWNRSNYLAYGLAVGSGGQLAVSALNAVTDFASGQVRNNLNPAANSISNLTFANTGGGYGGNLDSANAVCAPDYWADRGGGPVPATINPSHNGKFSHTGDLTLNVNPAGIGRTAGTGNHVSIYVEGDVYISSNITYQFTSYNNLQEMASFRLVVRGGNIYVAPGVTTLNGLFVAIPTNATNGRFYTCSNGFAQPTLAQLNSNGPTGCRQRLTVYGSIVADLIKFSRSGGTLNNSEPVDRYNTPGNPAELIINTPDTWLTSGFNGGEGYNAITTLPPVL